MQTTLTQDETIETATWRVWRGALSIRVTHIVNAGKRGKKCFQGALYCETCMESTMPESLVAAIVSAANANVEPAVMCNLLTTNEGNGLGLDIGEKRGVDVASSADKLEIVSASVRVQVSPQSFSIRNLLDVTNGETMISKDRTGPAKVLAWTRANAQAIHTMTFADVTRALSALGVRSHYYCAVDLGLVERDSQPRRLFSQTSRFSCCKL